LLVNQHQDKVLLSSQFLAKYLRVKPFVML